MEAYENAKGGLSKCEQDKQGAPTEEEDARVKREKVEEEVKKTEDEVKPKAEEMLDRLEKLKKKLEDVEIPRAKKLKVCHMSDSATDAANKEISSFEDETRRDALELYTTMLITAGELNDIRHALELDVKACEKKLEQQKAGDSMQAEQKSSTAHAAEPHQAELQPSKANQEEEPSDATKLMSMKQEKEQKEEDTATPEVEPQQKIEEKVEGAPSGAPGCCK
ncbi:unnamed protein product [Amoebophrya sp. A25]|nr:unnamed protein product [Amoebophrya sp. A25]|eukprot:GSA25T00009198001.1